MKECAICTKMFEPKKKWALCCCSECKRERQQILARWKNKYNKKHKKKEVPKKKKVPSLAEINAEARKCGMDYGNYIARVEGGAR